MRTTFTDKEAAPILGVKPRHVSQAMVPALRKIALLYRADPAKTMRAILEAIEDLEPMSERELRARESMLTGKANRSHS